MGTQRGAWRELFEIDLRSLALFRMGLAVSMLADLALRSSDLVALYTDQGALPGSMLLGLYGRATYASLHYWAGMHPALQGALFAASAAAAVALLVGAHTRLATLACWYLVSSLQLRNPLVYFGGDSILRLLLFWGLLLPLGARLSVDASRGRARPLADPLCSGASAALLLQVGLVYWATGLRKSGELWWSGQAVSYALRADEWATPLGVWLRDQPALLEAIDYGTLGLELFGPFLAFIPFRTATLRMTTVALFWGFHLGLAACMNIGLFPLFSMVAWLPFLPARIWRGRFARPSAEPGPPALRTRLASVAALGILTYISLSLAEQIGAPRMVPAPLHAAASWLRLDQAWAMFAPDPPRTSFQFELDVALSNGTHLRIPAEARLRLRRHWWKARSPMLPGALPALARYYCTAWNRPGSGKPRAEWIALDQRVRGLDPGAPEWTERMTEVPCLR